MKLINNLYVFIEGLSENVSTQTQNIWNECIVGHKKERVHYLI